MTRLFYVMIVTVAAMLLAAPAWAAVPWPPNCTVEFYNPIDDSVIIICPNGDGTAIDVTIRDQFNQPMSGQVVNVTFDNPLVVLGSPCTGITNAAGFVRLPIKGGVNNPGPFLCSGKVHVRLFWGLIEIDVEWASYASPDYNGSQYVDNADYAIFGSHWHINDPIGMADCVSNFSRGNPRVENADYAIFGSHWHHSSTFPTP